MYRDNGDMSLTIVGQNGKLFEEYENGDEDGKSHSYSEGELANGHVSAKKNIKVLVTPAPRQRDRRTRPSGSIVRTNGHSITDGSRRSVSRSVHERDSHDGGVMEPWEIKPGHIRISGEDGNEEVSIDTRIPKRTAGHSSP
jgi:hypothetical protein